ncbi:oxidoreductase family protein [Pluteus cervinus]|uniref:Oxidoreductase family protein n=1 Tax=Pluteus cervinus TaxID=181527 RepID=A0ACD3AI26_9AGAR|nr:oxidoreductase family protein [Pluteus cervinus]
MSTSVGTAILGAGIFAKEAHIPALGFLGDAAAPLKAVYSRSEKSSRDLADFAATTLKLTTPPDVYHDGDKATDLDALLARTDIHSVIIALPITLQPSIVLKALAAGKHVLSEKPVAPDVASGIELIKTYNSTYKPKGLIWRVAENFEAEKAVQAAAEAIRAGKIGKVIFFKAVVVNYIDKTSKWYLSPWRTVPDYQGGFLLDGGVHTIAVLRTVLPHRLTHLSGFASLNKDYLAPHDTIHAIVKADSQFHGTVELTWANPTSSRSTADGFVITGTDGWLTVDHSWQPKPVFRVVITSVVKAEGEPEREVEEVIEHPINGVAEEIGSFFRAIGGQNEAGFNLGDPLEALRDVAFIQAGLNSNGQLVDLIDLVPSTLDV